MYNISSTWNLANHVLYLTVSSGPCIFDRVPRIYTCVIDVDVLCGLLQLGFISIGCKVRINMSYILHPLMQRAGVI
jgi:hypothetical protein